MLVGLMLYATPTRGSAWRRSAMPLVEVAAQPEVKVPVLVGNGVLGEEGQLLDVGVNVIAVYKPLVEFGQPSEAGSGAVRVKS